MAVKIATFQDVWNNILKQGGTQNVDVIASLTEDGINHYLQEHHKNDSRLYEREIKKIFNTQTDAREFTVKINISSPIQLQFPPYKNPTIDAEYRNKNKWYMLDSKHDGPEIDALKDDTNKIQAYCEQVNITLSWPKLTGGGNWEFKLKTLRVFAEAFAILNNDKDGYYVSLIPTIVRIDVANPTALLAPLRSKLKSFPGELKLLEECQEKFTDLLVIAMNIVATEQTPKLVRNIRIPVPVLMDRPILPALLNISENCLTVGAGIDKAKTEATLNTIMNKEMLQLKAAMDRDIEKAGGLLKMVSNNTDTPTNFEDLQLKTKTEVEKAFTETNKYLRLLEERIDSAGRRRPAKRDKGIKAVKDAYAVGINEYFFDNVVTSVIPAPKHDCTDWLDLKLGRGRACYWMRFSQPDVTVNPDASLTGAVNVDIGGALEVCIRKFWDCSWRWACSSLSIAVKGRPDIRIKLIKSNGVRMAAQMGGNLYLDTNLPFPFNELVKAVSGIIFQAVIGFINILLALLSFYVIYPDLAIPAQRTKIKLRDFDSFYYQRPNVTGNTSTKDKFISYKGGIVAEP